ncbi:helix-turn-helix transcriptional regulator [Salipaludibacillus aurantiacus]|uniref:Helix-turn-helix n=1 Tax=Salipaludibacillus aurantiacus TaxID=1601833 RepID=A0A1H9SFB0_9BACI|nr:helix-turn-helix transcriptional regulator [Salipaludibacillus aurantiacus]SER83657.1 Helix-turn-helix [Salipaludibacillus aurantiacus]
MHIGKRIKFLRNQKGLSQTSIFKNIISASHYSNIESARYEASSDILCQIASRLEVPDDYLTLYSRPSPSLAKKIQEYEKAVKQSLTDGDMVLEKYREDLLYIPSLTQEFDFLLTHSGHLLRKGDLSAAEEKYKQISYYLEASSIESHPKPIRFKFYYVSGMLHFLKRNYPECYENYSLALNDATEEDDEARVRQNTALLLFHTHNYHRSLIHVKQARNLFMNLHKWLDTVKADTLMGILYTENKEYDSAKKVLSKGLELARDRNYTEEQANILHNLGMLKQEQGKYEESIACFKESLEIKERHFSSNDSYHVNSLFKSYYCILAGYFSSKRLDELDKLLKKADSYCHTELHSYRIQVMEAKLAFELKDFETYENKMKQSIDYFFKNKLWEYIEEIAEQFSSYLSDKRQYKKAGEYLKIELEAVKKLYKERAL